MSRPLRVTNKEREALEDLLSHDPGLLLGDEHTGLIDRPAYEALESLLDRVSRAGAVRTEVRSSQPQGEKAMPKPTSEQGGILLQFFLEHPNQAFTIAETAELSGVDTGRVQAWCASRAKSTYEYHHHTANLYKPLLRHFRRLERGAYIYDRDNNYKDPAWARKGNTRFSVPKNATAPTFEPSHKPAARVLEPQTLLEDERPQPEVIIQRIEAAVAAPQIQPLEALDLLEVIRHWPNGRIVAASEEGYLFYGYLIPVPRAVYEQTL